ncbi:ABC transporter permease [Chelatococcus composti]|jgi:phospholipid/cholesterol/gamma-HCH transport system permease protein|uniref:Phospholipid/cholesterol/gamma-HCH transport system permease protein n=1 Tax=Chelatococcus composti TaxID=1743235 RepID=A0A841K8S8_9HYPH|nr:MlaE family lipid ABC transporter permease subunit [Chelatococcus composti]MBB6166446.1 phospholipid/cholesterol/gamma-HCH transport system permease protein [Chelatococcus composti]GGG28295.1 ABC transporter permease [Chelatococcus composti]
MAGIEAMNSGPAITVEEHGGDVLLVVSGRWTAPHAAEVERLAAMILEATRGGGSVRIDLAAVERLDTLGAWVLDRTRHELGDRGQPADFVGARPEHQTLLDEIAYRGFQEPTRVKTSRVVDFLADVGRAVVDAGKDFVRGVSFLGEVMVALFAVLINPRRFRFPALVHQLEFIAFRGVPIIALISFLVGAIVAQQGIFQLQRFGATPFVVDLIGILVLRELAVLLTSIMIAGRSGSAFTAEIGSMKMREEVDALRVMGLDPVQVLIVPRILALIVSLPLLTFLSMMSALLGGGLVSWFYGGISPEIFLARLQGAIALSTFLVGIIKAPFMALVIGLIASLEGLAVQGSAESLGRQVTSSVVKSIFMVIVVDGLFAMFFAAINY